MFSIILGFDTILILIVAFGLRILFMDVKQLGIEIDSIWDRLVGSHHGEHNRAGRNREH